MKMKGSIIRTICIWLLANGQANHWQASATPAPMAWPRVTKRMVKTGFSNEENTVIITDRPSSI